MLVAWPTNGAGRERSLAQSAESVLFVGESVLFVGPRALGRRPMRVVAARSSLRGLSPPRFSIPRFLHPRWLMSVEGCLRVPSTIWAAPRALGRRPMRIVAARSSLRGLSPPRFSIPRFLHPRWLRSVEGCLRVPSTIRAAPGELSSRTCEHRLWLALPDFRAYLPRFLVPRLVQWQRAGIGPIGAVQGRLAHSNPNPSALRTCAHQHQ